MRARWRLLLACLCASPALAAPHHTAQTAKQIAAQKKAQQAALAAQAAHAKEAAEAAQRADLANQQAGKLAAARVTEATKLQAIDTEVLNAAQTLTDARHRQAATEAALAARAADLQKLMPIMLRLTRFPAETLLAAPVPPDRALLGLLTARGLAAQIAQDAAALRDARAQAIMDAALVLHHQLQLKGVRQRQQKAAQALDQQLAQTRAQAEIDEQTMRQAQSQAAQAAATSDSLKRAITAMEQAEKDSAAQAARDAALADQKQQHDQAVAARTRADLLTRSPGPGAGAMTGIRLVSGHVVKNFGAPGEDGPTTGMTLAASPGAVVLSPCLGRIGFAGPFRSYGKLMIIECGHGDDFVVSGMDRLDIEAGVNVRVGEPIARMGQYDPETGNAETLYVELRRNGTPIDPRPYLIPAK